MLTSMLTYANEYAVGFVRFQPSAHPYSAATYAGACSRMLTYTDACFLPSTHPYTTDGASPATRSEAGKATPAAPAEPAEPSALLRVEQSGMAAFALEAYEHHPLLRVEQSGMAAFALEAYEHVLLRVLSSSAVAQVHCKS
jgi:hypothetical protein